MGACKKWITLLDLCVSSFRRVHANLPCIFPLLTDDYRRRSIQTKNRNGIFTLQKLPGCRTRSFAEIAEYERTLPGNVRTHAQHIKKDATPYPAKQGQLNVPYTQPPARQNIMRGVFFSWPNSSLRSGTEHLCQKRLANIGAESTVRRHQKTTCSSMCPCLVRKAMASTTPRCSQAVSPTSTNRVLCSSPCATSARAERASHNRAFNKPFHHAFQGLS